MRAFIATIFIIVVSSTAFAQQAPPDASAKIISATEFKISAEDVSAGIEGTIKVGVNVNKAGDPTKAWVYVGPAWPCGVNLNDRVMSIINNAREAVQQFKFSPAIKDGKRVDSQVTISLNIGKTAIERNEAKTSIGTDKSNPEPKPISAGVLNNRALSLPAPRYPDEARQERASGAVVIQVLVDEEGKVIKAQAINGSPILHFAARSAACRAEFPPTLVQGHPVKVSGVITYLFNL